MAVLNKPQSILMNSMRDRLIAQRTFLNKGNCYVTTYPDPAAQIGRKCVQIYYHGSNFDSGWSGGNIFRNITVGVRYFNTLAIDDIRKRNVQTIQMVDDAQNMTNDLHLFYGTFTSQEPLRKIYESQIRKAESSKGVMYYIDQHYQELVINHG